MLSKRQKNIINLIFFYLTANKVVQSHLMTLSIYDDVFFNYFLFIFFVENNAKNINIYLILLKIKNNKKNVKSC